MKVWKKAVQVLDIPFDGGGCVKFGDLQIALFHYDAGEWYASENRCPHSKQMVLARGLIGDVKGEPKIVCPLHKHGFSLKTGIHFGGNEAMKLQTYPAKEEDGYVWVYLDEVMHEAEFDYQPSCDKVSSQYSDSGKLFMK